MLTSKTGTKEFARGVPVIMSIEELVNFAGIQLDEHHGIDPVTNETLTL